MEFKFLNLKIFENLEHKFNLYYFYKGYDFHTLLSDSLDKLRENNPTAAMFIINFEESIIDKLNREGVHKIHKTETNKRHNLYMNRNSIFHLSSKVLLLDLITNKISSDMIEYLLIGNFKRIDTDSKEMFILKYLVNNSPNTKFLLFNNESCNFLQDLNSLIRGKIFSRDNFKINFFPRNHIIIEKTIDYSMNIKGIQIFEYNLEYNKIEDLQQILIKLYDNCRIEIIRLAQVKDNQIEEIFHIDNMLSEFSSSTINELITAGFFNFKQRRLIKDCFILKRFLIRLEYLDIPTMLLNFNSIIRDSDDSSYFRYKDSETMFLIESFTEALKKKIFYITDHRANSGINPGINSLNSLPNNLTGFSKVVCNGYTVGCDTEELFKKYDDTLQLRNERNNFILKNYSINLCNDLVKPSPKLESLLSILDSFNTHSDDKEREVRNILIIVNSQNTVDNLKEFLLETYSKKTLISTYADSNQNKRKSNSYYEKKLRNFLITKSEFLKRQKIIKSSVNIASNSKTVPSTNRIDSCTSFPSYIVENLLLHKLCIDLCYKYDQENIKLFETIMESFSALGDDNMPSEIDVTEEIFSKIENTITKGRLLSIIPHHNVYIEHYNFEENLIKFKEGILSDNISHLIFFDFNLELLRYTECIINTYEECKLDHIYILNTVNCYNFKKETLKVRNEFEICKKIYNDYKQFTNRKQDINYNNFPKKNSSSIRIDITKNSSHLMTKSSLRSNKNILLDFREMSSKLPFYLYDFGFNLVVGGLDIGDYITSNSVCIERKSITTGDLFESLKSGRLVNQIIKMQRYYEHLIILCEFEDDIIFMEDKFAPQSDTNNLKNNNYHPGNSDINFTKLNRKTFFKQKFLYKKFLELKTMCNKIHILWSKNPKMTASLLNMLKNKYNDYLDIQRCLNCGNKKEGNNINSSVNLSQSNNAANNVKGNQTKIFNFLGKNNEKDVRKSAGNSGNTDDDLNMNLSRYEEDCEEFDPIKQMGILVEKFLRNLDGVNLNNFEMIYKNFKNLKEFVNCSREKFVKLFGKNGNKIFYFFNSRFNKNKVQ